MVMKRYLPAVLALAAVAAFASPAEATVTAISSGVTPDGSLYPIIDSDSANDSIYIGCGADGNVKINSQDPVTGPGASTRATIPCSMMTAIDVDGGAGNDHIFLDGVSREEGFTDPRLCAPCPGGGYSIVAESDASEGDDGITASPIGASIGSGVGMAGKDRVVGGSGREVVALGPGSDTYYGDRGNDYARGGNGRDFLKGQLGDDRLYGDAGDDSLFGDAGDDYLTGNGDHDHLDGGSGFDHCAGGSGRDVATASCDDQGGI
jgi:Ca2+-binding RTX toxin-like protein